MTHPSSSSSFASSADLGDNPHYLGQRLLFTRNDRLERGFSEARPDGFFLRVMLKSLARLFLIPLPFTLLAALIVLSSDEPWSVEGGARAVSVVGAVLGTLMFLLTWLLPYHETISEWQYLVEGRAEAADSAYGAIHMTLHQRNFPLQVTYRRIRSELVAGGARNYLLVRQAPYTAYVGVFAYGNALYVDWMLTRVQSPVAMLYRHLKVRLLAVLTQDGAGFRMLLAAELPKALREAVHSAVREGVQVASDNLRVPMEYAFGREIPVTDLGTVTDDTRGGGGQAYGQPSAPRGGSPETAPQPPQPRQAPPASSPQTPPSWNSPSVPPQPPPRDEQGD